MSMITRCEHCGGVLLNGGYCPTCEENQAKAFNNTMVGNKNNPSHLLEKVNLDAQGPCLINKNTQAKYCLTQSVCKIGRDQNNNISLAADSYVSRHHAWVLCIKGCYWVEDLGSRNGTLLNGELLTERKQISPGDCLKLGRTELVFQLS